MVHHFQHNLLFQVGRFLGVEFDVVQVLILKSWALLDSIFFCFTFEVCPVHCWQLILDKFRLILNQVLIISKLKGEESLEHQQLFLQKKTL